MSADLLGKHFDIHGGGQDLQFPHHENEIAQSEGANGCKFVNYWMHNGFVRVDNEKMSKSLGNFFTIREVLEQYDAEVVRFFILRAHYRSPLNYSDAHLDDAKGALTRLYTALKHAPLTAAAPDWSQPAAQRFRAAMDDDFNTPEALAVLFDLASEANRGDAAAAQTLRSLGGVLGLLQRGCGGLPAGGDRVRRPLRSRNRGADRRAPGGAQGKGLRRVRPHPRRARRGRHRAGRRGRRNDLAACLSCHRGGARIVHRPSCARGCPVYSAPDVHAN